MCRINAPGVSPRRALYTLVQVINVNAWNMNERITGAVLAGGRGSRMGGVDKGLQPFRGATMVQHVIERLAPQVDCMMINANQNLPVYRQLGVPVWPDEIPGFAGPLAGLHASLRHCETAYLATVPCDSPFLPADLVARLRAGLLESDADLAVAVTGSGEARQPQPVFCLLKRELLASLDDFLQAGGRKIGQWHAQLRAVEVRFEDEAAFENINTLGELQKFDAP